MQKNKVLIIFLVVLTLLLIYRAKDIYRWSDWGFGDAQTILTLNQWEQQGWIANYLLFKPQGYFKDVNILDEPELRQHAHGTCKGSSPNVGPRLFYTHYPAGYLVPYAFLTDIGLGNIFYLRIFSILISISALYLMYLVFNKLADSSVAIFATIFYALSPVFLGYADSLANQPIDDLLRFAFMLAIVSRKILLSLVLQFILSLVSFDSVLFCYVWAIGWHVINKTFFWQLLAIYACPPALAHILQYMQNVWYLGWDNAWIDVKEAFLLKNGANTNYNSGLGRLELIILGLSSVFAGYKIFLFLMLPMLLWYKKQIANFDLKLLVLLFICGLAFVVVLPNAARMPYESRQMIPFLALLIAGFIFSFVDSWRMQKTFYMSVAGIILVLFTIKFIFLDRLSVYELGPRKNEMEFAQQLPKLPTKYEPVYFSYDGFQIFWDQQYMPGYPQILPITEVYADNRLILAFSKPELVTNDLRVMICKGIRNFSPVLISRDVNKLDEVTRHLKKSNVLKSIPESAQTSMGRVAMNITDFVNWEVKCTK